MPNFSGYYFIEYTLNYLVSISPYLSIYDYICLSKLDCFLIVDLSIFIRLIYLQMYVFTKLA